MPFLKFAFKVLLLLKIRENESLNKQKQLLTLCWRVFELILAFLSFRKTFENFVKVISLDNKDFSRNFELLHTRQVHDQWIYFLRQQHFIFQPRIFYLHQIQLLKYFHVHSIFGKKWPDKVVKSICNCKIGSPFMIYVFYFKDCHL